MRPLLLLLALLSIGATPLKSPKANMGEPLPVPIPIFDLATAILKAPVNSVIIVPAGTNLIRCDGSVIIKAGVTIRGASATSTFVQRDPNPVYAANNQPVLRGIGDNITIEDLTLDANAPADSIYAYSCLTIQGRSPTVRRVRGIHASGHWATANECFAFFICSPASQPDGGGLVSECTFSDPVGDYVEAFAVWGSCQVRDCVVRFPVLASNAHPPFLNGFQATYSYGASIRGCIQTGGTGFFYDDTGSGRLLDISGCKAFGVQQGIIRTVASDHFIDGFLISDNVIELSPSALVSAGANGIAVSGQGTKRNCSLRGNLVRYLAGVAGPAENAGRLVAAGVFDNSSGSIIAGNSADVDFVYHAEPSAAISGNVVAARAVAPE